MPISIFSNIKQHKSQYHDFDRSTHLLDFEWVVDRVVENVNAFAVCLLLMILVKCFGLQARALFLRSFVEETLETSSTFWSFNAKTFSRGDGRWKYFSRFVSFPADCP